MVVLDPGLGMFEKIYCQQVSKPSGTFSVPSTMCTRVSYRGGGHGDFLSLPPPPPFPPFPQNYDVIIISTATIYTEKKNTWVTSPVFWSSQLQTCCVCDALQTLRDALVSCPSCYLVSKSGNGES